MIIAIMMIVPVSYSYAVLSCSVTTSTGCSGIVMLRMSSATNAQAELPLMSTPVYDNNVICCTGVTGLGNSCSESNKEDIVRLSGTSGTNAHVEQRTESNVNYNNEKICLSSIYGGDEITIGYRASDCTGYNTTLFSMSATPTNSMVGGPTSYNNKVCAKVFSQSISFNITSASAGFGNLSPTGLRYATADGLGSATEAESYALNVNTNAPYGYIVMMKGDTLKNNALVIDPIGGTNTTPAPGSKAFGIRAIATGGIGAVASPYDGAGFAYDASGTTFTTLAQASSGDGNNTNYSVHSVATIDSLLNPGIYSTNLTYVVTANF